MILVQSGGQGLHPRSVNRPWHRMGKRRSDFRSWSNIERRWVLQCFFVISYAPRHRGAYYLGRRWSTICTLNLFRSTHSIISLGCTPTPHHLDFFHKSGAEHSALGIEAVFPLVSSCVSESDVPHGIPSILVSFLDFTVLSASSYHEPSLDSGITVGAASIGVPQRWHDSSKNCLSALLRSL